MMKIEVNNNEFFECFIMSLIKFIKFSKRMLNCPVFWVLIINEISVNYIIDFSPSSLKIALKEASGWLVGFDLMNIDSFNKINYLIEQIEKYRNKDFPLNLVIFGNKYDCYENIKVKNEDIEEMIEIYKVPFFKTSEKDGSNVKNLFEFIIKMSLIKNKQLLNEIGLSEDIPFESIKIEEKEEPKLSKTNKKKKKRKK